MRPRPSASSEEDDPSSASTSESTSNVAVHPPRHGEHNPPPLTKSSIARSGGIATGSSMDTSPNGAPVSPVRLKMHRQWPSSSSGAASDKEKAHMALLANDLHSTSSKERDSRWRARLRNPWSTSLLTLAAVAVACILIVAMMRSFMTRQLDPKGYRMSYMRSSFIHFSDFDTEHTRFATKYNFYLYREAGVDEDARVKGVPMLFIPGNAGSYKQVRSLASEAANYYQDTASNEDDAWRDSKLPIDFFTVDFNEDITAFHGQTLLDQAEYLNDAVAFILSLYHNPDRSLRDASLPDPSSVILIGHSMGGVVARTMLTMPNYQANTINTIITLSAPHARPPVSFDADMVHAYETINDYWRESYSQQWGNENPLWHLTLISIAGGGLDTVVPSDYASIASIVPETHGFTVFTSTMPNVWTGVDHLAITWCDQLRKSIVRALFETIDVRNPAQTRRRAERMRIFKKWFLTGLEDVAEKALPHEEPKVLLTLEDKENQVLTQGERLVIRGFGREEKPRAYLMPVPPAGAAEGRKFTLLSDQNDAVLDVLFCSVFPSQAGQSATLFSMNMGLSGDSSGSTRLACKSAMPDLIQLPPSTETSRYPFDEGRLPFSFLQYDLETLSEHQFVAVVDKATSPKGGFVVAEFSTSADVVLHPNVDLRHLLMHGLQLKLPAVRPVMVDIKIPALQSSLLAYHLKIKGQGCPTNGGLFKPLVRQYIADVYESRFFVNVQTANISMHGIAPYMPPSFRNGNPSNGLAIQLWADPTCQSPLELSLHFDLVGSMGKVWMRYRTLFAALPLLVVALALRKQFAVYDDSGVFISFSEAMSQTLTKSFAIAVLILTGLAYSFANGGVGSLTSGPSQPVRHANGTLVVTDYSQNDYLLGNPDTFFIFLVPVFSLISLGICSLSNWLVLALTHVLAILYAALRSLHLRSDAEQQRRTPAGFAVTSIRQRAITTSVLLLAVSTVIPYQFAYIVLCIVQMATCVRAWLLAVDSDADANYNFYNYAHGILVLMVWILPINLPVLVVWVRNLAVHWLTPFSSHHNVLAIMPFIVLVETLSTGRMVPRIGTSLRLVTGVTLFTFAVSVALFGVSYAYQLHHFANLFCAWLVLLHMSTFSFSLVQLAGGDVGGDSAARRYDTRRARDGSKGGSGEAAG